MMKRKTLQLLTGALLCQPLSAGELQAQEQDKERPNILFILSDDHTSQSWGIYGGILAPYVKNDNIKRLADEGCVLDNCFCTNSISAPSRATILTGAYSHLNGVRTLEDSFDRDQDNIAKQMQAGGYQTALFGNGTSRHNPPASTPSACFTTRENTLTRFSKQPKTGKMIPKDDTAQKKKASPPTW